MKKKKLLTIGLTATLLFSNQLPTMQALAVANEEATEQVEKTDSEVEKDTKLPVVDETPEPETPKEPEVPATPEVPETPEAPTEVPETPEIEVPETPAAPEVTEPSEPEVPETPSTPEVTEPTTEDSEVQVETVKPEAEETKKATKKPTKQIEKANKEEKEDKADNKAEGENVIVDDNLREAILRQLMEYEDENPQKPVTKEMLERLTILDANSLDINDLSGLNGAKNLTSLSLASNKVRDIQELSGLLELTHLHLDYNSIEDISSLSNLPKLIYLNLGNNEIKKVEQMSNFPNLTSLFLDYNSISDVSGLSGLNSVLELKLQNNNIKNIDSISNMSSLQNVDVRYNNIGNLSPLKTVIDRNGVVQESDQEINIDITSKNEYFITPLIDIEGNFTWFTGESSIPGLTLGQNGKVQINRNILLNSVHQSFHNWYVSIVDHAERTNFDGIEDPALLEIIEIKLGRKVTSAEDLKTLKELDIYSGANSVKSLKGLEYATNLKSIGFYGVNMELKNISSLNNIGIEELSIGDSNLDLFNDLDVSNVNHLSVFNTENKDWDKFFSRFSNLESLNVNTTNLSDIKIIPTIVNDTAGLFLWYNQIRDLSPLSSHKGTIYAYGQEISITTEQSPLRNPIIGLDGNPVEVTRQDGETFTDELIWETEEANFLFSEGNFTGNISVIDGESMLLSEDKLEGEVIEDPTLRIVARFAIKEMKENQRATVGDWRTTEENLKVINRLDIWDIYDLGLDFAPIQTLEGLQVAENLRYLEVYNQEISSIQPIKELNLDYLDVSSNQISDFSGVKAKNIDAYGQQLSYTATKKDGKVSFHKNDLLTGKHGKERFWSGDQELEVVDNMIVQAVEEGQTELLINVSERHGSYEGEEEPEAEDNTVWTDVEGYSLNNREVVPSEEGTSIQATVLVSLVDAEPETDPSETDPENTEETDDTTEPTDDSNGDGGTDDTSDNTNPSDSSGTDSSDGGANGTSDSSNAGKGGSQNGGSNSGTKGKDLPKTGETVQWGASLLGFGLIGAVVAMWKKRRKS